MNSFTLDHLNETQFEEFCYDLLHELNFKNLNWRKGTGLTTSPSDRGRDIECEFEREDVDRKKHTEKWFVECKHHQTGVPPEKLQSILTWATAERPNCVLIIVSNFLSNPAKDYLSQYQNANKPPFRIKFWEKPDLEQLTANKSQLLRKYNVIIEPPSPYLAILHRAHILYLKSIAVNSLDYFFKLLDSLDPEMKEEIISSAKLHIINPRTRKPVTGNETLRDLLIDSLDYESFRKRCYFLAHSHVVSQSLLVETIVGHTLRILLMLGDTTAVDEKIENIKRDIVYFEEEKKKKPKNEKMFNELIETLRVNIQNFPKRTERSYLLYQVFCDRIVGPLMFEPILFPKEWKSLMKEWEDKD